MGSDYDMYPPSGVADLMRPGGNHIKQRFRICGCVCIYVCPHHTDAHIPRYEKSDKFDKRIPTRVYICIHVHIYTNIYVYLNIVAAYMYIYIYVYVYVHIYVYTYKNT